MQNIQIQSERKEIAFLFRGKSISMDAIGNPTLRETIRRNVLPRTDEMKCGGTYFDYTNTHRQHSDHSKYYRYGDYSDYRDWKDSPPGGIP